LCGKNSIWLAELLNGLGEGFGAVFVVGLQEFGYLLKLGNGILVGV
jgi:hypothetical protein